MPPHTWGLARAYSQLSQVDKAPLTRSSSLSRKTPSPDIPILKQASAECAKLRLIHGLILGRHKASSDVQCGLTRDMRSPGNQLSIDSTLEGLIQDLA